MKAKVKGNSDVQLKAEKHIVALLEKTYRQDLLRNTSVTMTDFAIRVDATNMRKSLFVEIYAHQGQLLDGQRKKISRDLLKLVLLRQTHPKSQLAFVHANDHISKYLAKGSWISHVMSIFNIQQVNMSNRLSPRIRQDLLFTQRQQAHPYPKGQIASRGGSR